MQKFAKSESGQAMVEMALILPVLLLLIMGILEAGWLFSNKLMLDNVCREAARSAISTAAQGNNNAEALARVQQLLPGYAAGKVGVQITYTDETVFRKGDVRVHLTYPLAPITPLVGTLLPEGCALQADCVMKVS